MIIKTLNLLKNHPKKSVVFGVLSGFGINFAKQKYEDECLMRAYCEEALQYGEAPQKLTEESRHITVILNPTANDGKSKSKYEKYCAPLLHLAGMKVALIRTEHEDQAKQIMDVMDNTSAVVVAGGDGTLSEILTGLLRREDAKTAARRFPLGILPLGATNSAASSIWGFRNTPDVKHLAESTMSIIKNWTRSLDVLEITPLELYRAIEGDRLAFLFSQYDCFIEEDNEGKAKKPVYAASQIEWGAFRDARERKSDYWYWAFLKKYMVYVFCSYKDLSWNCAATVDYFPPCRGCFKCKEKEMKEELEASQNKPKRWWEAFIPRSKGHHGEEKEVDYSTIINEECGQRKQVTLKNISDVRIVSKNTLHSTNLEGHTLSLRIGREDVSAPMFIEGGWQQEKGEEPSFEKEIILGELTLTPNQQSCKDANGKDRQLNIDSEPFEVRPFRIRPRPNAVTVFARPDFQSSHPL